MEIYNPFNPFIQVSIKNRIKKMAEIIYFGIEGQKQRSKDLIELNKLEKPVYKKIVI